MTYRPEYASAQPPLWKTPKFWRWIAIICIGVFLLSTIGPGQAWDGDAELFILGTLNILQGESYGVTRYIVNPAHAIHPAAYPPGLPILLAPMIELFGIDYTIIKFGITSCYVLMLAVAAGIATSFISEGFIILFVISLGVNPFVWHFKDVVFSELPFMLFAYMGLLAFDRLDQGAARADSRTHLWTWTAACAAAIAAAYEIRAIGVVLFAAVAIMSAWRFKRIHYFGPAILVLAVAFSAMISLMFPADLGTYISYYDGTSVERLGHLIHAVLTSAALYMHALAALLAGGGDWSLMQGSAVAVILVPSLIGAVWSATKRLNIYEVFLAAYLGALLIYPITTELVRYALPVLPLVLLYFFYAVERAIPHLRGNALRVAAASLVLIILYVPQYAEADHGDGISVDGPEAQELYTQIQKLVPEDAVIVCAKPTVIALHGQRYATNPPRNPTPEEFRQHVAQTQATWVVELLTPLYDELSAITPLLQDDMESVFENRLFRLYRIRTSNG